jgi:FPC/CPF motif-containing protein YcgG
MSTNSSDEALVERFKEFLRQSTFPCVGAKSALAKDQIKVFVARDIASAWNDLPIHSEIHAFAQRYKSDPKLFQSFAVLFEAEADYDEETFERHLWARLQSLTNKDAWNGAEVDPRIDSAPDSPHFSLSFGGEAFFVVGLHANASRQARRFDRCAMVFNLHDQFERLRAGGLYDRLRRSILERDEALQGTINPMLSRHGEASEARQYSGRQVDAEWRCPFQRDAVVGDKGLLAELLS